MNLYDLNVTCQNKKYGVKDYEPGYVSITFMWTLCKHRNETAFFTTEKILHMEKIMGGTCWKRKRTGAPDYGSTDGRDAVSGEFYWLWKSKRIWTAFSPRCNGTCTCFWRCLSQSSGDHPSWCDFLLCGGQYRCDYSKRSPFTDSNTIVKCHRSTLWFCNRV